MTGFFYFLTPEGLFKGAGGWYAVSHTIYLLKAKYTTHTHTHTFVDCNKVGNDHYEMEADLERQILDMITQKTVIEGRLKNSTLSVVAYKLSLLCGVFCSLLQ